ncbi:MAG: hypothetical protein KDF67_15190 [Ottowia sp.]|uniref:hypothetical protein n=1 Tax=Ottowia sp. TaxID=1898956 RepID=UPI001DE1A1F1|nr:hypothetical protein [Ottowia sp.]MCP5257259.1 hypothetical protein [Burkholderiaceae bacterium]MCB2025476.1 hypothetical protein [Ottowia sp.]MCB2070855.1 hypothetical protein [Ottowia sp.]HPK31090.1 hypothetical protein [Ottowia sp.]HRW71853.1 hypothetical protein [Ottowia sp.]
MKRYASLAALVLMVVALDAAAAAKAGSTAEPTAAPEAAAGAAADGRPEPWMVAERARIVQQREVATDEFTAAQKACWQKFAVNDCLRRAQLARREKVDLLQRQEWVLNDLERRLRTQARLKALQDKQQN